MADMKKAFANKKRIYVKVLTGFDETGYVQPKAIIWNDGRIWPIDSVRDFRPTSQVLGGVQKEGHCYTVVILGQEKHLFFEKSDPLFPSQVGRWFVETG